MPYPPSAYEVHQHKRWLRHDMHLWIRHDAARWVKPGTDPADAYPTLKRERAQKEAARERARAAEDAAFDAWIEGERRWNAAMRAEVDELKAARARQRLEEAKYSPSQPRVPAGNPRGGQWSNRNEGGASFGSFGNTDGEANAEGTGGAEDTGNSGNSQDAAVSGAESSPRSEGDGTRYDDRLATSDTPSPGRTAMLGIMARAAARVTEAYRSEKGLFDLFGNRDGTVAYTTIDDKNIFGANSSSPTYTATDRSEAERMRDTLISKYPDVMDVTSSGQMPNNAVFHAESNVLLRAARENGGTLAGRSLDVFVDSKMCNNCEQVIPFVALELGNPTITVVDTTKVSRTFRDGTRLK